MLLLVVLAGARASSRAVCLPPGNWGSSHPCGNIAKCGENNVQQKKWKSKKIKWENLGGGKPLGPWLGVRGCVLARIDAYSYALGLLCDMRNITA